MHEVRRERSKERKREIKRKREREGDQKKERELKKERGTDPVITLEIKKNVYFSCL